MGLTLGSSSFGFQGIGSVGGGGGSATGYYGAFSDLTTQQFVANTITPLKLNTTDLTNGVSLQGTPQTQIKVSNTGVYNIQFSAQLNHTTGGLAIVTFWLRKNGLDIPATSTDVTIEGNNTKIVPAWNFLVSASANDYFELVVSATDSNCEIYYSLGRTSPVRPALPSLILTVTQANPSAGSGGGGNNIAILDEGVVITTAVTSMDFIGTYIHATAVGSAVAINFDDTALLQANGSSPLTANWNVGAFGITANTFTANNGFNFNIGLGGSLVSSSTTGGAKTWTLPNASGTIALTSDIPSLSGYLKADGTIPLTANWNVGSFGVTANTFTANNGFNFNVGLGGSLVSASTTGGAKTWTLPNVSGTIALASDIPSLSGYLKADGTIPLTANWNVGSFGVTANTFTANNGFNFNVGLGGSLVSASTTVGAKTWTLPNESGTILLSTSTITPTSGGTGQTSYIKGDTLYASATNVLSKLPIGSELDILQVNSGVPSWVSSSAFTVPILVTNATNLYLLQNT